MNIEDCVTADEASDLLGIERRSVYTYAQRLEGFPKPMRVGRTLLFDRQELMDWRARHPARPRREPPPG